MEELTTTCYILMFNEKKINVYSIYSPKTMLQSGLIADDEMPPP